VQLYIYDRWATESQYPTEVLFTHGFVARVYYEYETGFYNSANHRPYYTETAPTGFTHSQSMSGTHAVDDGYNVIYPVTTSRYTSAGTLVASRTRNWKFNGPGANK